jgi:hypothetical protein
MSEVSRECRRKVAFLIAAKVSLPVVISRPAFCDFPLSRSFFFSSLEYGSKKGSSCDRTGCSSYGSQFVSISSYLYNSLSIQSADRIFPSVPVERAADLAKSGSGRVHLHPEDPTILLGTGTSFTTQIKPRASITLGKLCNHASAQVEEVASDTELKYVPGLSL